MTIELDVIKYQDVYGNMFKFGASGEILGIGGGHDTSLINQVMLVSGRVLNKTNNVELVVGKIIEHPETELKDFEAIEAGSQLFNSVKQTQALE